MSLLPSPSHHTSSQRETSLAEKDPSIEEFETKSTKSSVEVITLGCRLNTYESQVMKDHATTNGLENTIIINTCAVTNEAERSSRQSIRKAKKANPDARIIVTGCSAQIHPDQYRNMPEVDLVLGNQEKMLQDSFDPKRFHNTDKVLVTDIMEITETAHHLISGFEDRARAFIQIQNGCDHRCTFCTIPFGRGNNRSVPMGEITKQIRHLVDQGCQEVVFTGVDITGYGGDLPGQPTLGQMTKRVLAQIPDLPRLRLSSVDPVEIDDDLFTLIATEDRLMPHMHISLQAGDDMILKRMKRRHLRKDAISFCEKVRRLRPDTVFGADIIAGFPTETDEMFQNTLDLVKDCNLTYLHVFPYSAREGTPAARMPQVDMKTRKKRAALLREAGQNQQTSFFKSRIGTTATVLIESDGKGHTEHFAPISVLENDLPLSTHYNSHIVNVQVTSATKDGLIGHRL